MVNKRKQNKKQNKKKTKKAEKKEGTPSRKDRLKNERFALDGWKELKKQAEQEGNKELLEEEKEEIDKTKKKIKELEKKK